MAVVVRLLDAPDAARWQALRLRALREEPTSFLAAHDEEQHRTLAEVAGNLASRDPGRGVFGAFDGDELVGCVGVGREGRVRTHHRAVVWGMYVAPEARGRGVGAALLGRAIALARDVAEIEELDLTVSAPSRAARQLYERLGFVAIARRARATRHGDSYVDEDEMVLRLRAPRGARRLGDDELADASPSEAVPALLAIARAQVARKRPADVVAQHARDPFVAPSRVDLRASLGLDALALAAAPEFDALLLSPLAPLAVCAAVSPSSQDRIVTTMRGSEVVSDPTNVLAVECVRRLASDAARDVRLCTVHQVVRAQRVPPGRGLTQHFRMFALAEAGAARADHGFEVDAVLRHQHVFQRLISAAGVENTRQRARLLATPRARPIADRVHARLAAELPQLAVEDDVLESSYYDGLRLLFDVDVAGEQVNLSDTGLFDWVARLSSNRRLRFVASGFGLQRLATSCER